LFGNLHRKAGSPRIVTSQTNPPPGLGFVPQSNGNGTWSWVAKQLFPGIGATPRTWGSLTTNTIGGTTLNNAYGRITGSPNVGTVTNAASAFGSVMNMASSASTGSNAGYTANGPFTRYQLAPRFIAPIIFPASGDLVNMKFYGGMFTASPGNNDPGSFTTDGFGFYYATTQTGVYFRSITCNNGGSSNYTLTTLPVAILPATLYLLAADATNPNYIKFYINGQLYATHNTNLPTAANSLGFDFLTYTTENVTKNLQIGIYFQDSL